MLPLPSFLAVESVVFKAKPNPGDTGYLKLGQLVAESGATSSEELASRLFEVKEAEEDRQAQRVSHNKAKNEERAAKKALRDKVASRLWPSEDLWLEFLIDSGKARAIIMRYISKEIVSLPQLGFPSF